MAPEPLTSLEICAGAGGQAFGLEQAGFEHLALVENDEWCCRTLRSRRRWKSAVREIDLFEWTAARYRGKVDLFAGGVPCPPFSRAGRRLGPADERDLFPRAVELVKECAPRAILFENVRGLLSNQFADYRRRVIEEPLEDDYAINWRLINALDFGVPQVRQRVLMVALRHEYAAAFEWPEEDPSKAPTVGKALRREMAADGWPGAPEWAKAAAGIAPTLVGGSKKHGGPDLGPTQAKKQWERLGVNAHLVAQDPPGPGWNSAPPILTVRMAAVLQGFPANWPFAGARTNAYRQVGNAFPPPVARAVGLRIRAALTQPAARPAASLGVVRAA
jgi:DNA (cytosine-5)-methyltransferase 1